MSKTVLYVFNLGFYIVIFLMVKDTAFAVSQAKVSELGIQFIWDKAELKGLHVLYVATLIVGLVNIVVYKVKPDWKRFVKHIVLRFNVNILSSALCTSTLHFVVFAVGIYFSVISSTLNDWISLDKIPSKNASLLFSFVIAGFTLSIVVFILNQSAIGRKKTNDDQSNQRAYRQKIEELQSVIRLSPPNGFAKVLSDYVDVADDFVQAVHKRGSRLTTECGYASKLLGVPDKEIYKGIEHLREKIDTKNTAKKQKEIEKVVTLLELEQRKMAEYIRTILVAYSRLAALFDGITPSEKDIYRANLMLKYNIGDKSIKEDDKFRYVPTILKGGEKESLKHYLTLHQEHSVKVFRDKVRITKRNDSDQLVPIEFLHDEDIETFSLPFFLGEDKKHYNCFGAPRAVSEVKHQIINNTEEEIESWRNGKMSPIELVEEADENFSRRDIAKSIISIPIMNSRYDEIHASSVFVSGVVNIYRDKPNIMMGNFEKQEQFVHITTPLNFALSKIVAHDMVYRYNVNLLKDILEYSQKQQSLECEQELKLRSA